MTQELLKDLAKVRAIFQQRAVLAIIRQEGTLPHTAEPEDAYCGICGDHDCIGGLPCETGDGI